MLDYLKTAPKDKYGGCLGDLISHMPAIRNHMELMAVVTQQPSRKDKIPLENRFPQVFEIWLVPRYRRF